MVHGPGLQLVYLGWGERGEEVRGSIEGIKGVMGTVTQ